MAAIWSQPPTVLGVFSLLVSQAVCTAPSLCPISGAEYYDKVKDKMLQEYFECPGPDDPSDHTICCDGNCCLTGPKDSILKTALIICVTVASIATCITFLTCCLWPKCPLHDTCRGVNKRKTLLPWVKYTRT